MIWSEVLHNDGWDLGVRKDKILSLFLSSKGSCGKMVKMVYTGNSECNGERKRRIITQSLSSLIIKGLCHHILYQYCILYPLCVDVR